MEPFTASLRSPRVPVMRMLRCPVPMFSPAVPQPPFRRHVESSHTTGGAVGSSVVAVPVMGIIRTHGGVAYSPGSK